MSSDLREAALEYHRFPTPGKISVTPTKPLANQRDLALAYSPGVAAACDVIVENPAEAATVTARANLVGVVTNGTAVLGLGNIGPLAAKPVMEGKGVLFKKFAGIDVFDIEISEADPDKLVEIIASLEPTFGGINLEDIKAPECFVVESKLRERMKIPVFHDDQHGTAIIVGAAVLNALRVVGKKIEEVRLVCSGAGAAALSCLDVLVSLGMKREHIIVCDIEGVVYEGRTSLMDPYKIRYAQDRDAGLGRRHRWRRHIPGPVRAQGAEARDGGQDGRAPAGFRAGQSDAGNHAGRSAGGASRRHHRHRQKRLSQSGQQCLVLSLPVQGGLGRRRHHHQRSDEASGREGTGRAGDGRTRRPGGVGLWRRGFAFRPQLPDPQTLRSPVDSGGGARRGQGRHGQRRGHKADRRFPGLPRPAKPVRLPLRASHEAGLRAGTARR
nr:Malic oxidoreductase family protein [uncultured bacterium]